jgi:hypothetical protein
MRANTLVAVAVTAVVLYVILRSRAAGAAVRTVASASDVDWIPDPEADAAWWALHSGGTPSAAGSMGTGTTTPATKLIDRLSHVFRGDYAAWSGPNANTNQVQQLSFSPPGATIPPGPVPPEQPTPQGPTEPTSPWLPPNLRLAMPVASSPWTMDLSLADPYALIAFKGGWIDVERVAGV